METNIINYNGVDYLCREILDLDNKETTLTVAPVSLLNALKAEYGEDLDGCDLDETIFYYADPDEMLLSDRDLFKLIIN